MKLDYPFDRLTALLCSSFNMPVGLVSVVVGDETVFRSQVGLGEDSLPRTSTVSNVLVNMGPDAIMLIEDATKHPVFQHHPLVVGPPYLRFFAGATISNADGLAVGAVGVADMKTHPPLEPAQLESLKLIARIAGDMVDRAAAARIQAEQLQLLAMAETVTGIGHWRLDRTTNRVVWSDEVYRIYGVDRETFNPSLDDALKYYHPEDRVMLEGLLQRAGETGEGFEVRLRLIRDDGEMRHVISRGGAERLEDGSIGALFGVFQDLTDADRAQERLIQSEARYRLLAEHSSDIITMTRLDGIFTYVSPVIEVALGYRPEELIGQPYSKFVHPEDLPAMKATFVDYVAAGPGAPSPRVVWRTFKKNGELTWFEGHPKLTWDANGRPLEIQDLLRDVTETKRLEAELLEARDRAEAAAQAKSEFLANMSHELRTPLTSVIGFSGLLQASNRLPAVEQGHAERIHTASGALLSVINDILDYSKLEAGAAEMEPRAFDPRVLTEGAAAIIETQCVAKGLTLTVEVDPALPAALTGDEGRLRQVLLNFLSNAVKFTAQGAVRLVVGGRPGAEGRWTLRAEVIDSGIGISDDQMADVFDRFTQADTSTTRIYGGTGLGLAISQRLIETMGGEVGVKSRLGEGSSFWFEVPLPEAEIETVTQHEIMDEVPSACAGRVLLADDAPANRDLICTILKGLGLEVDAVCDGQEAVEAVQAGHYDLVLMDVQMPVMDGLAATRVIRAMDGPVARIPILALTANVQREQVELCLEAGMDGHLGKPIQVAELARTLASWLTPTVPEDPFAAVV